MWVKGLSVKSLYLLLILIVCVFLFAGVAFSQVPDWKNRTTTGSEYIGGKYNATLYTMYDPGIGQSFQQIEYFYNNSIKRGDFVDHPEAYAFIKDDIPEDSVIMCWWDYGDSITGYTGRDTVIKDPSREIADMVFIYQYLSDEEKALFLQNNCTESHNNIMGVARLMTSTDTEEIRAIMNKYNATYLFVDKWDADKSSAFYYALGEEPVYTGSPDFSLTTVGKAVNRDTLKGFSLVYADSQCAIYKLEPGLTLGDIAAPVSALLIATGIGVIGLFFQPMIQSLANGLTSLFDKFFGFLIDGIKSYIQRLFGVKEAKVRKTTAVTRSPVLLGISRRELLIAIVCIFILGAVFAYAKVFRLTLDVFVMFILAAGLTTVIHELAHRYFARRYNAETEFKFWDIGTISLLLTSLVFKTPMGQPGRNITNKQGELSPKVQGLISLAGPVASLLLALLFLLLMSIDIRQVNLGLTGFKMSMLACVYSLMPFEPMEGMRILKWNKPVWGLIFLPALGFYLFMLIFILP